MDVLLKVELSSVCISNREIYSIIVCACMHVCVCVCVCVCMCVFVFACACVCLCLCIYWDTNPSTHDSSFSIVKIYPSLPVEKNNNKKQSINNKQTNQCKYLYRHIPLLHGLLDIVRTLKGSQRQKESASTWQQLHVHPHLHNNTHTHHWW